MPLTAVGLQEIHRIFDILDRRGISREAVVIPLRPAHPGQVRVLPDGKLEIVVESEEPFDAWLPVLDTLIERALAGDGT